VGFFNPASALFCFWLCHGHPEMRHDGYAPQVQTLPAAQRFRSMLPAGPGGCWQLGGFMLKAFSMKASRVVGVSVRAKKRLASCFAFSLWCSGGATVT